MKLESKKLIRKKEFLDTDFVYPIPEGKETENTPNYGMLDYGYSPAITETITTQKKFSLPPEIVSQIVTDAGKLFQKEALEMKKEIENMKVELELIKKNQTFDNVELELTVIKELKKYLMEQFRGKFVAVTYDKKIIESANSRNEILESLKKNNIPKEQLFIYGVPLK